MLNDFTPEIFQFIRDHENDDERNLVLKHKSILGVVSSRIAEQISARRKAKLKLPSWYMTEGIVFPPQLNLEQSSSEATGRFKQKLLSQHLPALEYGTDLTGGFGVDTFFLSRLFRKFQYNEPNNSLRELAAHNLTLLGASNITYHSGPAEDLLTRSEPDQDLIFIDPSRRVSQKKILTLAESEPNVIALQVEIFQKTKHLLVKASPLLDITLGVRELKFVKNAWVVAVDNEVKEVLFFCEKGFAAEPGIVAVNLNDDREESFSFRLSEEANVLIENSDPQDFLYEPNVAILKSGAFKTVAQKFDLKKIHPNTHLYTAKAIVRDFPGRIFRTEGNVITDLKEITHHFPKKQANIITRNYPLTVDELKRKYKLNDGGEKYLLAFSGQKRKFLLAATRLK